jgi:hypothetical protein
MEDLMRIFVAAVAMALLTVPAYSQSSQSSPGSRFSTPGGQKGAPQEEKSESRKLVDDKAYKSALDRIHTEKKYDPWRNAR